MAACDICGVDSLKVLAPPRISATATPNRAGQAMADALERDRVMGKDMEAYKRIRKEGLQPPRIDGCAELEARANYRTEIEMGRRLPPHAVWQGSEMASEMMGKEVGELVRASARKKKESTE